MSIVALFSRSFTNKDTFPGVFGATRQLPVALSASLATSLAGVVLFAPALFQWTGGSLILGLSRSGLADRESSIGGFPGLRKILREDLKIKRLKFPAQDLLFAE